MSDLLPAVATAVRRVAHLKARADYEIHREALEQWARERRKAGALIPELVAELEAIAIDEGKRNDARHREKVDRAARDRRARYQAAVADAHEFLRRTFGH